MRELARDQVGDGDEMAHGAVAAGLGLGGLNLCIRRLDTTRKNILSFSVRSLKGERIPCS
jgi:hypothetical protein